MMKSCPMLLAVIASTTFVSAACLHREHADVEAARQAHLECVAEHSPSHTDCVALEERLLDTQRRYEQNARRAWGCDPAQEDCPTPR